MCAADQLKNMQVSIEQMNPKPKPKPKPKPPNPDPNPDPNPSPKPRQVSIDQMKQISDKAKSTWDKFRKERGFHKMLSP